MQTQVDESTFRAAAIQMATGVNRSANIDAANRLVTRAARDGAQLVVLPEYFNYLGPLKDVVANAETIPGPTYDAMRTLAASLKIWLVAGSLCVRTSDSRKGSNTSIAFNPDGDEVARYQKIHLFNIDIPEELTFKESDWVDAGATPSVFESPFGRIGLATCFDLRFPELFRALVDRGMEILCFPSAFFEATGRAHWETLLRARAIENQVVVVASNQAAAPSSEFAMHGHSMIIDAWGEILSSANNEAEAIVSAEIDPVRQREVRRTLPVLKNRRIK